MNRFKSGIKQLTDECYVECLNDLTNKFVKMAVIATVAFFSLGFIFPDREETNE